MFDMPAPRLFFRADTFAAAVKKLILKGAAGCQKHVSKAPAAKTVRETIYSNVQPVCGLLTPSY